jgi:hypothetical protein
VEYTKGGRHSYWADVRRKNGCDAPWKVTYWGLGNEVDGPWQLRHKSAREYAWFALTARRRLGRLESGRETQGGRSNARPISIACDERNGSRAERQAPGRDLMYLATHSFGDDKKVVPLTKQLTAQIERNHNLYLPRAPADDSGAETGVG